MWDDLTMQQRADVISMAVKAGMKDLSSIRSFYNNIVGSERFDDGGRIHISPSKRGTFTAAATKHGKSVQQFAAQVLANKENYSPAMVKKANFARNAAKWHGLGGNLFYEGGPEDEETYGTVHIPEVTVAGYRPIKLKTYYPLGEDYPYTGHSRLEVPLTDEVSYAYGLRANPTDPSVRLIVDKRGSASDYNLVTNNCADATLHYLNRMFSTEEQPWLFTTPGDVRDFAINHLGGRAVKQNGIDTVLIPRNSQNAPILSQRALEALYEDPDESNRTARVYEDGGPLEGGIRRLQSPKYPWTMEDESNYRAWRESLPLNLRYTNDNDYDMRGAYKAGLQPQWVEEDKSYHLASRDPQTGRYLKAPHHRSTLLALIEDAEQGYEAEVKDGALYTNVPNWAKIPGRLYYTGGLKAL